MNLAIALIVGTLLSPLINHRLGFFFLGALAFFGFIHALSSNVRKLSYRQVSIQLLVVGVAVGWAYGVVIGLASGNRTEYVLGNFFGMVFYLSFFGLLAFRPTLSQLINGVFLAAVVYGAYGAYLLVPVLGEILGVGIGSVVSVSDLRILYLSPLLYLLPFITLGLFMTFQLLGGRRLLLLGRPVSVFVSNPLLLLTVTLIYIFVSMSKAFILALGIVLILLAVLVAEKILFQLRAAKVSILLLVFSMTLGGFVLWLVANDDLMTLIIYSFSAEESSNSVRSEQLAHILGDLSVVGSGLGAVLSSGYFRVEEAPYGLELTFFSVAHKLGVMAVFVFSAYLLPLFWGLRRVVSTRGDSALGAFVFGAMLYVVAGYANPLLFSSNFVALHCVCLYVVYIAGGSPSDREATLLKETVPGGGAT